MAINRRLIIYFLPIPLYFSLKKVMQIKSTEWERNGKSFMMGKETMIYVLLDEELRHTKRAWKRKEVSLMRYLCPWP
jgi:hypothetical protein